jgi:hypothetical protein
VGGGGIGGVTAFFLARVDCTLTLQCGLEPSGVAKEAPLVVRKRPVTASKERWQITLA